MSGYRDFAWIKRLTRVEGTLVNETPLRVGVGTEPPLGAPVDLAVYRVNGVPCIPGSSLKGVFRSFVESLAASEGYTIHSPWDSDKMKEEGRRDDFCPICGIFGSTELASHVRIYDACPKDAGRARTFMKTGISISREFGAVQPGLGPFTEEFVEPGVKWSFRMDVVNIRVFPEPDEEDVRAKLLRSLFESLMRLGLNVGARKTTGCGLAKLEEIAWRVYEFQEGMLREVAKGTLR